MTAPILTPAQENHNTVTKSGYQWLVWWFGKSAGFTTPRRAQEELARLQRYEAPQKQALSLLETLYTQYDSMAEQYEAMTQYIKTTFSLEKLNKVIDQLTADLLAVSECHPQMVQQAQAQAVGTTAPDSVTLNEVTTSPLNPILAAEYHRQGKMSLYELALVCPDAIKVLDGESVTLSEVTTEDEWPTVSISLDDEDFCHPDSLGDLYTPQMQQQWQAQATTLTDSRVEYAVDVAGDSEITAPDSPLPDSFDGMTRNEVIYAAYQRGLITDRTELARLAPIAPLYEYKLNVWQEGGGVIGTVSPKVGMSVLWGNRGIPATITAITAWGVTAWRGEKFGDITIFPEHLRDLWVAENMVSPDSIKPIKKELIEWTFDCQGFSDGLFFQAFIGSDGYHEWYKTIAEGGRELIKPRTPGCSYLWPAPPYSGELTLGDFVEAIDEYPRPIVALFDDEELRDDSLGDLWQPQPVQLAQAQHRAYPPTPKPYSPHWLDALSESFENGTYTFQAPADSRTARTLHTWFLMQQTARFLESRGYPVAAQLKADFGFWVTPKTLAKKIRQAIAQLSAAKKQGLDLADFYEPDLIADEAKFIEDVVKKLGALAC